ncbi:3784_t:CDS:1 [Funneliformis geosporum]|nr:3784_t:CDS:1 [Funneliformis geosporum]
MTDDYIKRLKSYYRCSLSSKKREQSLLKFYGLTRDPSNGEYMLVIQYTEYGNIRTLLNTNFSSFQWSEKVWWLCDIASYLLTIHKAGYVHGNIHPGNILQLGINQRETSSTLVDAGLSLPANHYSTKVNKKDIYGVLPYMAPEVILGHPPTKESDIYSIGMLMIELSNGLPPYSDRKHDSRLALEIVKGSRPQISQNLPQVYIRLALDCCSSNPSSRPNAKELLYVFSEWWTCINNTGEKVFQIQKAFMDADEVLPTLELVKMNTLVKNSDAFYTSRLLKFEDVLKRVSSGSYFSINYDDDVI